MTHELICSWLGLAECDWPPDHYRLLGLQPGESNLALIEQRVQQRLDSVRRYQMMYPEQATEAMNRLAQAFVCLTEPTAKKLYDASLLAERGPQVATEEPPAAPSDDTLIHKADAQQTWTNKTTRPPTSASQPAANPPPLPPRADKPIAQPPPLPAAPPPLPASSGGPRTPVPGRIPPLPPLPPLPPPPAGDPTPTVILTAPPQALAAPVVPQAPLERVDPILEAARSPEARRGLGTRRSLYRRLQLTRQLLDLWIQAGKYLSSPQKRVKRQSAAEELDATLGQIVALLPRFPPRLGQAGQPGYLVVSLFQQDILETFQTLDLNQRLALSADWQAGQRLLRAHRDFVRQEVKALRHQTLGQRLVRVVWAVLTERPGMVLVLLALIALNVAVWRYLAGSGYSWH